MSTETIEQKLSDLERRMLAVETANGRAKARGAWREIVGWEEDDALFRDAVKLGAEWRERANAEGK